MFRIIDRYIVRETLSPILLSLLVFTFVLLIPPIMRDAQELIAKGVDGWTIAELMLWLVPQGLGITIPVAVLIGLLMGLGRLSGDREIVVMQACGVSTYRLLRPILTLALVSAAATCYTLVVLIPKANQAYREIAYRNIAAATENDVKARVFYQGLPDMVLYVNEVDLQGTGWSGVFLADTGDGPGIYVADEGRIVLDPESRQVDIVLRSGASHEVDPADPSTYNVNRFDETVLGLDFDEVFPDGELLPGLPEMTIAELRARTAQLEALELPAHNEIMALHQKFSFPVACLVFGFIGLALGVTTRRDGKLASFALGIGVVFAYYILWFGGQGLAKSALISPHWAVWICNIALGMLGVALLVWRARFGEHRFLPALPRWRRRPPPPPSGSTDAVAVSGDATPRRGVSLGGGIGWGLSLLDRYVAKQYLKLVVLSFVGLLGIFYIVTFLEIYDRLLRGDTTLDMVLEYFWYATPQWVYYVLPISALVATLVTVGLFTKTSELTVMKACGISLYRVSLPLFAFAMLWSGTLFGMSESFLADANRQANELRRVIRGGSPEYVDILQRRWLMGEDGTIYNYGHFDPTAVTLDRVTAYRFAEDEWRLAERVFAGAAAHESEWQGRDVWAREFGEDRSPGAFETSAQLSLPLAPPESFAAEPKDAERMNYRELERYIADLSASGEDVVPLRVELQRKLSFPFVTLILTLIAVPFAVTMGRHGALSGVGIGIVLALSYWVVISIFAAIGSAGIVTPLLAAWAPNVLFGGSAAYLLLAART